MGLDDCCSFQVRAMDKDGLGKVRFVGAWAISKVLKTARKYVGNNLYTEIAETRAAVSKNVDKIQALESTIIVPYSIISSTSKYPETLHVTEARQYRSHGFVHVSDAYYEFPLELEQRRIECLNSSMLKIHCENLIEVVDVKLKADQKLMRIWMGLFETSGVEVSIV
ncbi:hypothetical protein OS493_002008 [Desmophyllum pertusum]|uniref:Uncharacterized protein n=1 Tax=Desmophyllum pertusum TaxID=174260 RepID=A0A9W9Z5C9_9CNID|nr:hypothetical protein OS493_002008 [Desmophyllum pertusum]